jgi:hypothetical protein
MNNPRLQFLYAQGLSCITLAKVEVANILLWIKNPDNGPLPELTAAFGNLTYALDMVERLKELSQNQQSIVESIANQLGEICIQDLDELVTELDGTLLACEIHQPELFNKTLNDQLTTALAHWQEQINLIEFCDEEELTEILQERDLLEYTRIGINIIRLEYPRLKDIQYVAFAKALKATDTAFRKSLKGATYPLPYADRTFWWRN